MIDTIFLLLLLLQFQFIIAHDIGYGLGKEAIRVPMLFQSRLLIANIKYLITIISK